MGNMKRKLIKSVGILGAAVLFFSGFVGRVLVAVLVVVFGLGVFMGEARAVDGNPPSGTTVRIINPLSCGDVQCVGQAIINGLFMLAIPIVSIMVLWGGFQILTAGGDPAKFTNGKKTLIYAVVGFAVVLVAQGVVFIIKELFAG